MKSHKPFEPRLEKNYALIISAGIFAAAVAVMWKFSRQLGIDGGTLMMLSGTALFTVLLAIRQYNRKKERYNELRELINNQQEIGTGDYSDTSIFFREEDETDDR